jgi:hypothetical protein
MPDHEDSIYESVNRCRMDIAELRGMITMHFRDGEHHHPPCVPAQQMQRTLLTATGAAVLSLVSALGLLLMEFLKHG